MSFFPLPDWIQALIVVPSLFCVGFVAGFTIMQLIFGERGFNMKLGDIFQKLGNVELTTIIKWYGRIVVAAIIVAIVLLLMIIAGTLLYALVSALPWWGTLLLVIIVTGGYAFNKFDNKGDNGF